jgi:hypothetical protein
MSSLRPAATDLAAAAVIGGFRCTQARLLCYVSRHNTLSHLRGDDGKHIGLYAAKAGFGYFAALNWLGA